MSVRQRLRARPLMQCPLKALLCADLLTGRLMVQVSHMPVTGDSHQQSMPRAVCRTLKEIGKRTIWFKWC